MATTGSKAGKMLQLWRLPGAHQAMLLRAAMWLTIVRIALWVAPFPRVWRWFGATSLRGNRPGRTVDVQRLRWAVDTAARRIPGATCLVRALALRHLLWQHGISGLVRIGVARSGTPALRAHAWVEVDGVALASRQELNDFRAFPVIESAT